MREKIFGPYGMTTSSYTWQPRFEANYCHGHDEAGKVQEKDKDNAARSASTLETTTRATTRRFLRAVYRQGLSEGRVAEGDVQAAGPHPLEEAVRPARREDVTANDAIQLELRPGLGCPADARTAGAPSRRATATGSSTTRSCFPDAGIGVLIMSNSANGESIFKELLELTIADTYTPWEWQDYVPYSR